MNLKEAQDKFLHKTCDVDWGYGNDRKNATIPLQTTDVHVVEVYENCHGQILFKSRNKLTCPFSVNRLTNPR